MLVGAAPWALADISTQDDDYSVDEDGLLADNVLDNDDDDGHGMIVVGNSTPANGVVVSMAPNGFFNYTPNPNFSGIDSFTYDVAALDMVACVLDGPPCTGTATVTIEVLPDADAPTIVANNVSGNEDTAISLDVSVTLTDADGSETGVAVLGGFPPGSVLSAGTDLGGGFWRLDLSELAGLQFTPPLNFFNTFTVGVAVEITDDDGQGNLDVETFNSSFDVDVISVNDPPFIIAPPGPHVTAEDTPSSIDLSGVFGDIDSTLVLTVLSDTGAPIDTAVMVGPVLQVTYLPNQFGSATVVVQADDGGGSPVSVNVNITVDEVNDPPVLVNPLPPLTVDEDAPDSNVSLVGVFDDDDIATAGDSLTYSAALSGDPIATVTVVGDDIVISYVPNRHGSATINYAASDGTAPPEASSFPLTVNLVNDAPFVANEIPDQFSSEDLFSLDIPLASVFDDVDILTSGDVLTFTIETNSNPALFSQAEVSPSDHLLLTGAFDANGTATLTIKAEDSGLGGGGKLSVTDTFTVTLAAVDDLPLPEDDTVTMNEDEPTLVINVLDNDYLAEQPTIIKTAGVGGVSQGDQTTHLGETGDPITGPNATVVINGTTIEYTPRADYFGMDYFDYTIEDSDGQVSPPARVYVDVQAVNDPPIGTPEITYIMQENTVLTTGSSNDLFENAYDVDGALLDGSGNPVGTDYGYSVTTFPLVGTLTPNSTAGTFTYEPPINFTGDVSFTYRLQDEATQSIEDYTVRIVVQEAPAVPSPPTPGEVAINFELADSPLEQLTSVQPNVLVVMDDSGSMDWNISMQGDDPNGVFPNNNETVASSNSRSRSFQYLWDLSDNTYSNSSSIGRILPTEDALDANSETNGNQYGVWRARNPQFNVLYYDPTVRYEPWTGHDSTDTTFADAIPTAIRLDPIDATNTFNLLALHSYDSFNVPRWESNGGLVNVDVDDLYIPFYYATTVSGSNLAWDDPREKIVIRAGDGPTSLDPTGNTWPGSEARTDCANRTTCTYLEEIQNFANWFQYYRKREYVAKAAISDVVANQSDLRIGYETLNDRATVDVDEMNTLWSEGNKKDLLDAIFSVNSSNGTPLRAALERAGEIFSCNESGHGCPVLPAPDGTCQQNFTLLFSDGYWNSAGGVNQNTDQDGANEWDGGRYADTYTDTLADTAMHYYENDLHTNLENRVPPMTRDISGAPTGTFDNDRLLHQHMKTYTIAFGVQGTIAPGSIPSTPETAFTWPDPTAGSLEKIDDMQHAALNGRGDYLNAANPGELVDAIEEAFAEFNTAESSTSAASFSSTSLRNGTLLYRGFYDLRDNSGELSATLVNSDGTLDTSPTWSAADRLQNTNTPPANRTLVTFDAGAWSGDVFEHSDLNPDQQLQLDVDQVAYLRGDQTNEEPGGIYRDRDPLGLLGDIIHSSPIYVGAPRAINRDQAPFPTGSLYSEFVEAAHSRRDLVYVGANDGVLHAFDADTGDEVFGYIPNMIIDDTKAFSNKLVDLTEPSYSHQYYVDLTPQLNDAYVRPRRSTSAKSWNTVLVGGLGAGGKGYFALNVTDPSDFNNATTAAGTVLWEFTDEDDTYPVEDNGMPLGGSVGAVRDPNNQPVKDLGFALSPPSILMSNVEDGNDEQEWVAVFGNGPNSTAGIAKLFVLFMDAGLNGWGDSGDFVKINTGYGVAQAGDDADELIGYPNGLGTVTGVDIDLNGTVDYVYGGDRQGNLFRFDLSDADPDNWTSTRLFTATHDDGAGTVLRQPILSRPLVVKHPSESGFIIIFGTGSFLTEDDGGSTDIQSIYGIWDRGEDNPPTANTDTKTTRLVEQVFTNVVDDSVSPAQTRRILTGNGVSYEAEGASTGTYGWYIDLDMPRATNTLSGASNPDTSGNGTGAQFPGERAIRRLLFRNGTVITTTVLPSTGESACFGARPGALLLFDAVNGGNPTAPIIDFNQDGVIDEDDLVTVGGDQFVGGLLFNQDDLDGSLVDLSTLGGEGDSDWLFVSGGNDTEGYRIQGVEDDKTGRLSWREIEN